jgi:hypothetical protein
MANKILAVNVLLALGVCTFSVTLAVLLAPTLSSEAVLEWLTTIPPCGSTDSFRSAYSSRCLEDRRPGKPACRILHS